MWVKFALKEGWSFVRTSFIYGNVGKVCLKRGVVLCQNRIYMEMWVKFALKEGWPAINQDGLLSRVQLYPCFSVNNIRCTMLVLNWQVVREVPSVIYTCIWYKDIYLFASDIKTCTGISLGDRPLVYTVRWQMDEALSPFLTGRMFVRRTYIGHFDELRFVS